MKELQETISVEIENTKVENTEVAELKEKIKTLERTSESDQKIRDFLSSKKIN